MTTSSPSTRSWLRVSAWLVVVIAVGATSLFTSDAPPFVRMISIVTVLLLSMKLVIMIESRSLGVRLTTFQWLAFSLGWPGMRPALFKDLGSTAQPSFTLFAKAVVCVVAGFALLYVSAILNVVGIPSRFFNTPLMLLAGFSLILHFGMLNLSTAFWRSVGVHANELFRSPYKSRSLKEFWGRRWNVAFTEMTTVVVYRPLKDQIGNGKAMVVAFLFSGLLHEVAISLPVRAGYGLPMLYFLIHAVAMTLESKSLQVQRIISHKVWSHIWVMTLLILPLPLLFHTAFVQQVLVPLRDILLD